MTGKTFFYIGTVVLISVLIFVRGKRRLRRGQLTPLAVAHELTCTPERFFLIVPRILREAGERKDPSYLRNIGKNWLGMGDFSEQVGALDSFARLWIDQTESNLLALLNTLALGTSNEHVLVRAVRLGGSHDPAGGFPLHCLEYLGKLVESVKHKADRTELRNELPPPEQIYTQAAIARIKTGTKRMANADDAVLRAWLDLTMALFLKFHDSYVRKMDSESEFYPPKNLQKKNEKTRIYSITDGARRNFYLGFLYNAFDDFFENYDKRHREGESSEPKPSKQQEAEHG